MEPDRGISGSKAYGLIEPLCGLVRCLGRHVYRLRTCGAKPVQTCQDKGTPDAVPLVIIVYGN
jgi:hypothetical protein